MMGRFADELSDTPGTDFSREFTCDFFLTASQYWLHEYYVDGFRYDAPGILTVSPALAKPSSLTHIPHTRQPARYPRFDAGNGRSLMNQGADHLPDARGILRSTYSHTCWQDGPPTRLLDRLTSRSKLRLPASSTPNSSATQAATEILQAEKNFSSPHSSTSSHMTTADSSPGSDWSSFPTLSAVPTETANSSPRRSRTI
jgi:hypothetical protein